MDQHIEHILNQIPGWNAADASVAPLVGGITNQNYRVDIGGETFVLRIGGEGHAPAWYRSWTRKHLRFNCRAGWRRSRGYSLSTG